MKDYIAALEDMEADIRSKFPGPAAVDRLDILHAHLETVKMNVTAIFEEAERSEGYK